MIQLLHLLAQIKVPTTDPSGKRVIPIINLTPQALQQALGTVFLAIGGLSVFFLLVGAARYVTSNGEQAKIAQAKNTIIYAVIGIVISLSAFSIVQFVVGKL